MEEGRPSQDHREFTGVVRVIMPRPVLDIPGVESTREPHNTVPLFPPHPEAKDNLVVSQMCVVINTKNSLSFYTVVG